MTRQSFLILALTVSPEQAKEFDQRSAGKLFQTEEKKKLKDAHIQNTRPGSGRVLA